MERLYLKEERWRLEALCLKTDLDQMALRLKECKEAGGGLDQGCDRGGGERRGLTDAREKVDTEKRDEGDDEIRAEDEDSYYKSLKMVKVAPKLKLEEGRVDDPAMGLENIFGQLLQEVDIDPST